MFDRVAFFNAEIQPFLVLSFLAESVMVEEVCGQTILIIRGLPLPYWTGIQIFISMTDKKIDPGVNNELRQFWSKITIPESYCDKMICGGYKPISLVTTLISEHLSSMSDVSSAPVPDGLRPQGCASVVDRLLGFIRNVEEDYRISQLLR